ncbi:Ribose import ATP-binding protein RbsA [Caprobacter fermentans]|uniref:Ribose import ATP-binding protein RbsA n=1 Tax=Caproicibacter fermentans TaxID=2576756 RepID=A0A6N8I348_9FIRM|nr:sugar ABC transporter ATP-binding protein [Caproicibacter fermentans]MVB12442.1 Ribose import ATP-binding protein RbsA [Caproicibacter fermentans]OCN01960.1 sugar ABC transporter ATP-binding protein [Clostridium sp. W14A]QNK40539.1 sugar ABC transporter ATP-binding protein [Caproicibacter fermentans]
MEKDLFLETKNLEKAFDGIKALDGVSLKVYCGQIQGLIGENGSGKSTISSIISGIHTATKGEILLRGKPYRPRSPLDARDNRICMIVQETGTISGLSVADNLFLGDEAMFLQHGSINRKKMQREAEKSLEKVGLSFDVTAPIETLSFETRKLVEIARALYFDPTLLIVDETTTALSYEGRSLIHKIMRDLKEQNKAVLFISHDLPELMEICDRLTVLRDGKLISAFRKEEFDERLIKQTMVGRSIQDNFYRSDFDASHGEKRMMQVSHVDAGPLKDVTFDLHEGEILGVGGLSGSGMHELGKLLYGMLPPLRGEVTVLQDTKSAGGKEIPVRVKNIQTAMENGIGYVSKDRDQETLLLNASIKDNLVISALDKLKTGFFILPRAEKEFSQKQVGSLHIKCSGVNQTVGELSGGNKQKVSFGKWIGNQSRILILDSPTRGVDVGVKTTMYQLIYQLKKQGCAILIISEELPELIGMSDRVLIMKDGCVSMEFQRSPELVESSIIEYMI